MYPDFKIQRCLQLANSLDISYNWKQVDSRCTTILWKMYNIRVRNVKIYSQFSILFDMIYKLVWKIWAEGSGLDLF